MKVFLGGTCSGYRWRNDLIPLLKCDYYNPMTKGWGESQRQKEVHERETADFVLYTITNHIRGVYSIAEVVDDSNKRPEKTLFCNLYNKEDGMSHSMAAVEKLLINNGIHVFHSLEEVAEFLNSQKGN